MADFILTCLRTERLDLTRKALRLAALRLAPPELAAREPLLLETSGVLAAVVGPTSGGVFVHQGAANAQDDGTGAVCLGGLFGDQMTWWHAGADAPEGTYALARWDARIVELVSDICGSRTLWYAVTESAFLASTSQRALVMLLGSFDLLHEAAAYFLASGTLGPDVSWDTRLRRVPPDSSVIVDRSSWSITVRSSPIELNPSPGPANVAMSRLRTAIVETCGSLNLDLEHWVVPLSGGHDSRALLASLVENGLKPRCVTWTTQASLRHPLSDASIATRLARRYGVHHELLRLDAPHTDMEQTIARFVAANEGRNDEISGYQDGFALWRHLSQLDVHGIIRGDQSFGQLHRPMQPEAARRQVGGVTPDDYPPDHLLRKLDLAAQTWPQRLQRRASEDCVDYRLRLSQHGYIPIVLAGLNEPKARYMEIVNPHLSRRVIGTVRSLPPEQRANQRAYRRITDSLAPLIPYARSSSTVAMSDFLEQPEVSELIVRELLSSRIERLLGDEAVLHLLTAMTARPERGISPTDLTHNVMKEASAFLPTRLAEELAPPWKGPEPLSPFRLGFRALLASRTVSLLEGDAQAMAAAITSEATR